MSKGTCLLCFAKDVKIFDINDTHLQSVYKQITEYKIQNDPHRLCYICVARLQQCYRLVKQIHNNQKSPQDNINEVEHESSVQLSTQQMESTSIPGHYVEIELEPLVKEESPDDFNEEDKEYLRKNIKCEQLEDSYSNEMTQHELVHTDLINCDVEDNTRNYNFEVPEDNVFYEYGFNEHETNTGDEYSNVFNNTNDTNNLIGHQNLYTDGNLNICPICNQVFNYRTSLEKHIKKHNMKKQYICDVCDKIFNHHCQLNDHKMIHNYQNPYTCDVCNNLFYDKSYFEIHKMEHCFSPEIYTSNYCYETFSYNETLIFKKKKKKKKKKRRKKVEEICTCDICNKSFKCRNSIAKHMVLHQERRYKCDVCNKVFRMKSFFEKHKRTHNVEKTHSCDVCDEKFYYDYQLYTHKRTHERYTCDICEEKFTRNSELNIHKMVHTGETPYHCEVCNKIFSERFFLIRHKLTHNNDKPYKCEICDQVFQNRSIFCSHVSRHFNQMVYSCSLCNKRFGYRNLLNAHIKNHRSEAYSCDVCNKTFNTKWGLLAHDVVHNGYKCDECDERFDKKDHLYMHMKTHSDGKVYQCDICDETFESRSAVRVHKIAHTREKKNKPAGVVAE